MSEQEPIVLSELFPVSPEALYAAWLDADAHGAMIGSGATISGHEGGEFTAWDGYISGRFLKLEPGQRLTMSWRSEDYPPEAADSTVEVTLEAVPEGTRMTLRQEAIPPGQRDDYVDGWREFYLEPMLRYFSGSGDATAGAEHAVTPGDHSSNGDDTVVDADSSDEGAAEWMPRMARADDTPTGETESEHVTPITPITLVPSVASVTSVEVVEVEDPEAEWIAVVEEHRAVVVEARPVVVATHVPSAAALHPATRTPAKKSAAKKSAAPAKKTPAMKSAAKKSAAPAKKTPAMKSVAKKTAAPAKKMPAMKSAAKKSAKKSAAQKPVAGKSAAKKPAAQKPAARKPASKKAAPKSKSAAKKPVAKRPAAQKTAAKKPAAKKAAKKTAKKSTRR